MFVLFQPIHYNGQILAMNDCGYRQTYLAKYLLLQDLDEFVVPTVAEDWSSMLDAVSGTTTDDVASYSFRNRFCLLQFPYVVDQASVTLVNMSCVFLFLIPCLHDTTGCQTGCTTGLTTGCIGCQTG